MKVTNPDWDGAPNTPKIITRNYNFGGGGATGRNVKLTYRVQLD